MPYFSIIIPVYNVAPYLRECLDSVLAQTFTDWEAICVDDGSTDESGAILDEYAAKDSRFRVFHQANVGVSCTRQAGLNLAHGQYIVWVDPDDFVGIDFLRSFHNAIMVSGADFVWCDCYEEKDGITKYSVQEAPLDPLKYVNFILEGRIWASLWNKAISNDFIKRNKISFPDQGCEIMEDVCFVLALMSKSPMMSYFSQAYYHYVIHDNSLIHFKAGYNRKLQRIVQAELYVERAAAVFGDVFNDILNKRKKSLKFIIYSNSEISNKTFYETFPDVVDLKGLNIFFCHRVLFKFTMCGFRSIVLLFFRMVRKVRK